MPPTLHPRSRQTVSLFTGTLLVSFFVVGLPHILPCPVPARAFADAGANDIEPGQRRRRRRNSAIDSDGAESSQNQLAADSDADFVNGRPMRECPVPKPGGLVGQILGFEGKERAVPKTVIVESVRARRSRNNEQEEKS
ncbi:uncharacterized protein K452DRAFT_224694 [Aplosporella prunicola CBS 121167]|uniref:Alpha-1,3-mannosyltransferase n=1 Tax=Aplosporella prunicola CBS 121167 TaxID=1176127 RepID=A0A6A6BMT9_9PEZI|nr:uncharacterized protein K452DRAFT_224694 [Aplosporella prunicola CBS 121167]KAF2143881.1 hypothetical protein K452DRAFT_224694 [Aplosporella prunicola CBS 121167]